MMNVVAKLESAHVQRSRRYESPDFVKEASTYWGPEAH